VSRAQRAGDLANRMSVSDPFEPMYSRTADSTAAEAAAFSARMSADTANSPYAAAVFAGGGCRCFWQIGFWSVVADEIGLAPRRLVGVSAGAAFAVAAAIGRIDDVLHDFKARAAANPGNFVPRNRRAPGERAFPHERIYGGLLRDHIGPAELDHVQHRQEFSALLAHPHPWLGARRGLALGVVATVLNQKERLVHARWGRRFGFAPALVSARDCETPEALVELILQSSCVPPIMPYYRRGGRPVIDGGVIDNAPAALVDHEGPTLVLLSFPHRPTNREEGPRRTYVQPSGPIPISQWDYTNPEGVQRTFDLGRADGERFLARWTEVRDGLG
jgi:predicted acylesterase/phospholipase RssA